MSWTPVYNAQFAKPLLNQLIAVIQRDQAAALAVINAARAADGNPALTPIVEFHKGPGLENAFPWLFLEILPTQFDPHAYPVYRHSQVRVQLALDVGNFDQEMVQEDAQDYARMLDMIVTSANANSAGPANAWETALPIEHETVSSGRTAPMTAGTVKDLFVESHVPGVVAVKQVDSPVMRISIGLLFELFEK